MTTISPYNTNSGNDGGSKKGSSENPYTQEEFEQMQDAGTWQGGYVEGMGYWMGVVTVTASYPDSDSYGSEGSWPSEDSWSSDISSPFGNETNPPTGGGGGGTGGNNTSEGGSNGNSGVSTDGSDSTTGTGIRTYNVELAVNYLKRNAYPCYIDGKCGKCAKSVRIALEAGGLSTNGHPESACDYDSFLPSLGFYTVDKNNYVPQKGDIIVLEAVNGHPHGHIAMYSGNKWISDFVQSDMWGGSAFRNKAEYTLFRK